MKTLNHIGLLSTFVGCFALPAAAQCTMTGTVAYWQPTWAGCIPPTTLICSANPSLGSVISLRTVNLPPATGLVATLLLLPPTPLGTPTTNIFTYPLVTGCLNYVPNATDFAIAAPLGGTADVFLAIPNALAWLDKVLHAQSVILSFSGSIDLQTSNGVCMHTGY